MKNLLFSILLLCFLSTHSWSWAAVAFDAEAGPTEAFGTSVTHAHTVTGANPILLVCMTSLDTGQTFGATYNSVAMTLLDSQFQFGGSRKAFLFYMLDPPTGSAFTVDGTRSTSNDISIRSMSFTGVDQGAPFGTVAKGDGGSSGTSLSASVTIPSGGMAFDCLCTQQSATGHAAQDGEQLNAEVLQTNGAGDCDNASSREPDTGDGSLGWTWTTDAGRAIVAVPINAASASGAGIRRRSF